MKIAVCCQNGRTVSAHPGKCSRFLLVDTTGGQDPSLLELAPPALLRHASLQGHPLADCDVILASGGGQCLADRLAVCGVQLAQTTETDPLAAATAWRAGHGQAMTQPDRQLCNTLD
ncbi:NifB/NifX family molybdenum-iron cluster-binding protein [Gulbenkiania mobilis]|uniref:NifB/NifX family molybdenum-iron cluster-binding protein n=1 Tax=Gulbenkiania mobilis TaxID=397457 RepID=UPI0006BBD6B2|nr:hypothetical protein [Gulbenkiania mobilis]